MMSRFSSSLGANINLHGGATEAWWSVRRHGGLCITDKPLRKGDVLEVDVECYSGGGHVLVGVTSENNTKIRKHLSDGTKLVDILLDIGIYKDMTNFKLEMISNTEILQSFRGKVKSIKIESGKDYRFSTNIQFGQLKIKILPGQQSRKFCWDSKFCGSNIKISEDRRSVSLIQPNPYSYCALESPLVKNQTVGFDITPGKNVKWHYLKLYASNLPPTDGFATKNFNYQDADDFVPLVKINNPQEQVLVQLQNNEITCQVGKSQINQLQMRVLANTPIYLYLELCRLGLKIQNHTDNALADNPYVVSHEYGEQTENIYEEIIEDGYVTEGPGLKFNIPGESVGNGVEARNMLDKLEKKVMGNKYNFNNQASSGASAKKSNSCKTYQIYRFLQRFDQELSQVNKKYDRTPQLPSQCFENQTSTNDDYLKPVVYLKGNQEELVKMIHELKRRVVQLEDNTNGKVVTSVKLDFSMG